METTRTFSMISNGIDNNGCFQSNSMDYSKLSTNHVNDSPLNKEKILEFCSQSYLSRLNESFIPKSVEQQSLIIGANGHGLQPPVSVPMSQCPTSSNFPRFPHPTKLDDDRFHAGVGINSPHGLQPRINSASRRTRHFVPNDRKDEYYWQKRRKNNEAARKSREKRRTIDTVLEEKVLILSHENKLLRNELYALKVKYGEIESDNTTGSSEAMTEGDKVIPSSSTNKPSAVSPTREVAPRCSCACSKQPTAASTTLVSSALTCPTSITLPKVNVILESDKLSSDTASSAKLVLTNLASGTLILSPINLSCKTISDESPPSIERSSNSSPPNDAKPEELKEVEAANTLANLFRSVVNGSVVEKQPNGNSSDANSGSYSKEAKKNPNLPCKLRFKSSKID